MAPVHAVYIIIVHIEELMRRRSPLSCVPEQHLPINAYRAQLIRRMGIKNKIFYIFCVPTESQIRLESGIVSGLRVSQIVLQTFLDARGPGALVGRRPICAAIPVLFVYLATRVEVVVNIPN